MGWLFIESFQFRAFDAFSVDRDRGCLCGPMQIAAWSVVGTYITAAALNSASTWPMTTL